MRIVDRPEVCLSLKADLAFLRLATSFVENGSEAFGMGKSEALSLTLACEEIFVYLCRVAAPGKDVVLTCRGGGYYVEEEFRFEARDFNMKAFNITTAPSLDSQEEAEETGLLIASRMVDRFQFVQEDGGLSLILIKEKAYPSLTEMSTPDVPPLDSFSIRTPGVEELKALARLAIRYYPSYYFPPTFTFPGKLADMAASRECQAAMAVDNAGHVGGGIVWRWEGPRLVEFYGPYLFNQPPESGMAEALVEACIGSIAREGSIGLITRFPVHDLPAGYFERLGVLTMGTSHGTVIQIEAHYRHLQEDLGLSVWTHPLLRDFLECEYRRLCFARELKLVMGEGETSSPFSVLSATFDRGNNRVTLRPVWLGRDSRETLGAHVVALRRDGPTNIFFMMDLGWAWHCHYTPALLSTGFEPRLVLPYAGRGDLVIFQHTTGASSS